MDKHVSEIMKYVPDLLNRKILDLGAGKGRFMMEIIKRGGDITGLEPSKEYVNEATANAKKAGVNLKLVQGVGEKIPLNNNEFDFVNMSEVIEHVSNPKNVMLEINRVLNPGGLVYISVPNRFGIKDQHFHLYFVNWMPRKWSRYFITIFGKHKDYSKDNGLQRLEEMHYFTYNQAKSFFDQCGFKVFDIREMKIGKLSTNVFVQTVLLLIYKIARFFYFDSMHFLLKKV